MSNENIVNKSSVTSQVGNPSSETFFCNLPVKDCKKSVSLTSFEIIKVLLRERAMKQVELASQIGLSRQALNNYIKGRWIIPTQIKLKISKVLGVDSAVIWDLNRSKK